MFAWSVLHSLAAASRHALTSSQEQCHKGSCRIRPSRGQACWVECLEPAFLHAEVMLSRLSYMPVSLYLVNTHMAYHTRREQDDLQAVHTNLAFYTRTKQRDC